jgi:hypothetical protein
MPRDMRAIVTQLQQHRPPVSNFRDLCALTMHQLTQVLLLSRATVSAEDFHRAVAAISSADNSMQMASPSMPSMQMPPPSMPSSAAASSNASSATVQPLNLHEKLPFFVYGTLCQGTYDEGFGNYEILIKVHPAPTCSARGSHQR